jgi:hypothetical protein
MMGTGRMITEEGYGNLKGKDVCGGQNGSLED